MFVLMMMMLPMMMMIHNLGKLRKNTQTKNIFSLNWTIPENIFSLPIFTIFLDFYHQQWMRDYAVQGQRGVTEHPVSNL